MPSAKSSSSDLISMSILSPVNTVSSSGSQTSNQRPSSTNAAKLIEYNANIRRDIFDFLMRIRSSEDQKMFLISRTDRKKFKFSKYCVLMMRYGF
jgi:hypothetical protein